jgi:serine/threonine protein kinase
MRKYRLLKKKGEGTFSEVLAAQNINTSELCAIKCELARAGVGALCAVPHRAHTERRGGFPCTLTASRFHGVPIAPLDPTTRHAGMKQTFSSLDQVNNLREIQALRRLSPHQNIVKLHEVLYDKPTGRLALVFE